MPKVQENAYQKYNEKVIFAQNRGYSNQAIIEELLRERQTIMPRCIMKQAILVTDRNIYKKREAARAAHECITAIDKIISELRGEVTCPK